jgi:cytochrome c-type biogenesis protein CcmF
MAVVSVALGVGLPLLLSGALAWQAQVALVAGFWIVTTHLRDLWHRARHGIGRVPIAYWGMFLAHNGFAFALFGIALTSVVSVEKDLRMVPGQTEQVIGLSITFDGVTARQGPNFVADRGTFLIVEKGLFDQDGDRYALHPEKRSYTARQMVMTEAAIDAGFLRDVYISLGEPLGGGAWAVRLQVKPFVRWIWLGGLVMALGGIVAVADARYRRLRRRHLAATGAEPPTGTKPPTGAEAAA